ncbi:MAG TPA: hypothetical protein VM124_03495 [Candidatus Limnocylindrales bacterium]|nr:hypothetical protein [Candidatus Limnocylindrales bacterium]
MRHLEEGPYTGYWYDFPIAKGLTNATDIAKTRALGSYVGRLSQHVIREVNPHCVAIMPDMQVHEPQAQTISNAVAEWDRSAGSLNHYGDGQGDLLRGAGLLLHANHIGDHDSFGLPDTESSEVYVRFMSLFGNNSLEQQAPTRDLLLAGQLIHKAGWVEDKADRQGQLFAAAVSVYDRIYKDPNAAWIDRLIAGQYRSDIYFDWLAEEMREAVKYQDKSHLEDLQAIAMDLIRESAADLQQTGRLLASANALEAPVGGWRGSEWAGFMLEGFVKLAVRDMLHVRSKPTLAARYGVRSAFAHEDNPRNLKIWPKQSFDIVVQRRDIRGNIAETTPFQLKLRSARYRNVPGQSERDYGGIRCIGVTHLSGDKMLYAVDNLLVAYARDEMQRGIGSLATVQSLFSVEVDERLVVAPA